MACKLCYPIGFTKVNQFTNKPETLSRRSLHACKFSGVTVNLALINSCTVPKQLTIAQAQQQLPNLPSELTDEPIIITQDGVPVIAALSYTHLTELLETLDILTDTEFVTRLRQSIIQSEKGNTISWASAKAQLEL